MGADYHIYLHGVEGGQSLGDKTKPFSTKKETPYSPKGYGEIDSIMNEDTGASALQEVAAMGSLITAVAMGVNKVLTTGFSHLTEYTGHYEYEMGYNNFKTFVRHTLNPLSYVKDILHRDFQFKKQNQQIEEEAKLLGDTIFKHNIIGV